MERDRGLEPVNNIEMDRQDACPDGETHLWMLNLSTRFVTDTMKEKFFITSVPKSGEWRRITVSVDYQRCIPGSLEAKIYALPDPAKRSFHIFQEIVTSWAQIDFYDNVTNLKLETRDTDNCLHVFPREDILENISSPSVESLSGIDVPLVSENELQLDSHLSRHTYKVMWRGSCHIKHDIDGPDDVARFVRKIKALHSLLGNENVAQLVGLVRNEPKKLITGILIPYASNGSLADFLRNSGGTIPWQDRERWMRQIVHGLAHIHRAGVVHGDVTLWNIMIDGDNNAQITGIVARGCLKGWVAPEMHANSRAGRQLADYSNEQTDIFQMGMVLWCLVEEEYDPGRIRERLGKFKVPDQGDLKRIIKACLSPQPQDRPVASHLRSLLDGQPRL